MKIVAIVIALLIGLASLLMSVCGGSLFISFGFQAIRSALHPTGTQPVMAVLPVMMFAAACAVGGAWAFWQSFRYIRRNWQSRE